MKTFQNIIRVATLVLLLGVMVACTGKFEEYNKPKYDASEEDMKGDNFKMGAFFPQLQNMVVPAQELRYQYCENLVGAVYGRYMMTVKAAWKKQNYSVYKVEDKWLNNAFNWLMSEVYSPWNEIRKMTKGEGINFAWAQILRVAAMHRMTDMWGPIPYTKVSTGAIKVPYDAQKDVYKAMFDDLNAAIEVLTNYAVANPSERPMAKYDNVYGGDCGQWVKFANSLKLRMAMRIRSIDETLSKTMVEQAVNHTLGVIESNADNAACQYAKISPLYVMWKTYGDTRVCADITSYMNGYQDPRREKYFQPAANKQEGGDTYVGVRSGADNTNDDWTLGYSAPLATEQDKIIWMTASEVTFLKAEAALVWGNMGEDAATLYEKAIRLSFTQWGAAGVDSYLVDNDLVRKPGNYVDPNNKYNAAAVSTITIPWSAMATPEVNLERIITQKWIALWPLGTEAWCEYRRTGYPKLFKVAQTVSPNILVGNRIPFCPNEYLHNSENMDGAIAALGGQDNYETQLWWAKK